VNACEPRVPCTCCWSRSPICSTCLSRPQDSFYALLRKRAMLQAHQQRLLSLCSHCAGTRELAQVTLLPFCLRVRSLSSAVSLASSLASTLSLLSDCLFISLSVRCLLSLIVSFSGANGPVFFFSFFRSIVRSLSLSLWFSPSFSLSLYLSLSCWLFKMTKRLSVTAVYLSLSLTRSVSFRLRVSVLFLPHAHLLTHTIA